MTITLAVLGLITLVGLFKVAQFVAWRWRRPAQIPGDPEIKAMNARAELAGHLHRCRLCGVEFHHRKKRCIALTGLDCTRCAHYLRETFWMGAALGAVIGGGAMGTLLAFFRP